MNSTSALGRSLNQGNVVVLSGTRDESSYPALNLLDMRVSYDLPVNRVKTSLVLDIFNTVNINTIISMQTLSVSAYGTVLTFIPPRILRLAVKMKF